MGCDIHIFLERRSPNGGWVCCNAFNPVPNKEKLTIKRGAHELIPGYFYWEVSERNYELFGALAGVRWDGPDPRGLPDGVSTLVQEEADYWGSDGHSHSWYPLKEFLSIWIKVVKGEDELVKAVAERLDGSLPTALLDAAQELMGLYISNEPHNRHDDINSYRVVFWFDN